MKQANPIQLLGSTSQHYMSTKHDTCKVCTSSTNIGTEVEENRWNNEWICNIQAGFIVQKWHICPDKWFTHAIHALVVLLRCKRTLKVCLVELNDHESRTTPYITQCIVRFMHTTADVQQHQFESTLHGWCLIWSGEKHKYMATGMTKHTAKWSRPNSEAICSFQDIATNRANVLICSLTSHTHRSQTISTQTAATV